MLPGEVSKADFTGQGNLNQRSKIKIRNFESRKQKLTNQKLKF